MGLEKDAKEMHNFAGLMYPPQRENEVYVLFGMLLPYLDDRFVIEKWGDFPDCKAMRNGKPVGIEFEVDSKTFLSHKHPKNPNLTKCSIIICWKNSFGYDKIKIKGQEIEILDLKKETEKKNLGIILNPQYQPAPNQDEKGFFEKLREETGSEEKYEWIKSLVEFCKSKNEFVMTVGKGKHQASLDFHISKWLAMGVGVLSPIQFYDNGSVVFDFKDMPELAKIELRRRIGENESSKKRWRQIRIHNLETFNNINEALRWLAEYVNTQKPLCLT